MAVNDENFRFVAGGRKYYLFLIYPVSQKMISAAGSCGLNVVTGR